METKIKYERNTIAKTSWEIIYVFYLYDTSNNWLCKAQILLATNASRDDKPLK